MPGIFGIIDKTCAAPEGGKLHLVEALKAMSASMRYEPFYEARQDMYADMGLYIGWAGHAHSTSLRPIVTSKHGLSLYLAGASGSEQTWMGTKETAKTDDNKRGIDLADIYERTGESFPAQIDNLVSGVLVDQKRRKCLLFTDRLGAERLFLYEDSEQIIFSSEAKAILAVAPKTRSFDLEGMGQYLVLGCTLGEKSLFNRIKIVPAGTSLNIQERSITAERKYFDRKTWELLDPMQVQQFTETFTNELQRAVYQHTHSDTDAAISLTGGLDCRMIMACLLGAKGTVPCYTFGSMYRDTYDVKIARTVAQECRQRHEVLVLGSDFLNSFESYLNKAVYISDGYIGFAGASELYLNEHARAIAPLRITGNYGGELLRGVRAFGPSRMSGGLLTPALQTLTDKARIEFAEVSRLMPASFTLFIQVPGGVGRYAIERSQVETYSPFLDKNLIELIYRMPSDLQDNADLSCRVIERLAPSLLAIPTDRGMLGSGNDLVRATHRIYDEALFKLEYWTGDGLPSPLHWLAGFGLDVAYRHLFRGQHKFEHFRLWLKKELAPYISDVISDYSAEIDECFSRKKVQEMFDDHLAGKANYTGEIDKITNVVLTASLLLNNRQCQL